MKKILVLGGGAWGTALANMLADNLSIEIYLWALEEKVLNEINIKHQNSKYLPKKKLNKKVIGINSKKKIKANFIFITIPSQYVYDLMKNFSLKRNREIFSVNPTFILCSKGIDFKRKALLSELIKKIFPKSKISVLSGPTFANTLASRKPTAATLAVKTNKLGVELSNLLVNNYFKLYISSDLIGVQVNGTLKNVLAIAAGISEGLGLGENARAAIISRGIKEVLRIVISLGGKEETVYGLSGLGDILLTCNSHNSRNFSTGYKLGKRIPLEKIIKGKQQVFEGIENIRFIDYIRRKYKLHTPIFDSVYRIVEKKENIDKVVLSMLNRPTKRE